MISVILSSLIVIVVCSSKHNNDTIDTYKCAQSFHFAQTK